MIVIRSQYSWLNFEIVIPTMILYLIRSQINVNMLHVLILFILNIFMIRYILNSSGEKSKQRRFAAYVEDAIIKISYVILQINFFIILFAKNEMMELFVEKYYVVTSNI